VIGKERNGIVSLVELEPNLQKLKVLRATVEHFILAGLSGVIPQLAKERFPAK